MSDLIGVWDHPPKRVLVTGDRRWATEPKGSKLVQVRNVEHWFLASLLDGLFQATVNVDVEFTLIQGCAPGADSSAGMWADDTNLAWEILGGDSQVINHLRFPADWNTYGRAAGSIRNQQMLDEGSPDFVVACHRNWEESRGTLDMVTRAERAGLPVFKLTSPLMTPDPAEQLTLKI